MSDNNNVPENEQQHGKPDITRREMSRRQFLTYTLGGTGGFLAAAMIVPMARFAIDPVLQPKVTSDWVKVVETAKIAEEPKSFTFQVHQVDGWFESDPELTAWIAKDKNGDVFALNPTCKHLGCTVDWNGNPENKEEYSCPCHGAHYTKDGKQLAVSNFPLDQYDLKIQDGFIYLGQLKPNFRVK